MECDIWDVLVTQAVRLGLLFTLDGKNLVHLGLLSPLPLWVFFSLVCSLFFSFISHTITFSYVITAIIFGLLLPEKNPRFGRGVDCLVKILLLTLKRKLFIWPRKKLQGRLTISSCSSFTITSHTAKRERLKVFFVTCFSQVYENFFMLAGL